MSITHVVSKDCIPQIVGHEVLFKRTKLFVFSKLLTQNLDLVLKEKLREMILLAIRNIKNFISPFIFFKLLVASSMLCLTLECNCLKLGIVECISSEVL